jgi:ribosomal protein L12E/L44/L45/RPP1/RPP2
MATKSAAAAAQNLPETAPRTDPVGIDAQSLLAAAIQAQMPVESMQRLLDMRAQLRAEQAAGAFAAALAEFQSGLPPIEKKHTADTGKFKYRYADLADIWRAIAPRLHACGLSVTFDTADRTGGVDVLCTVHHVAGHSVTSRFPVPVDSNARMNAAQAVGAALTYGRRYALTAALGIVTADEDTDAQGAPDPRRPNTAAPNGSSAAQPPQRPGPQAGTPPARTAAPNGNASASGNKGAQLISAAQEKRLYPLLKEHGLQNEHERVKAWIKAAWGVEHFKDLLRPQYDRLCEKLPAFAAAVAREHDAAEAHADAEAPPFTQSDIPW